MSSQKPISRQNSSHDANDSIASSFRPPEQRNQYDHYQSNEQITKLQQQHFHRSISNAESASSFNNNEQNMQRILLNQRKQVLLKALETIDNQMEELDMQ
jgi:hypothetical protein